VFHVEMRMGISVVREFNLGERELWTRFLAPLMADQDFTLEGHDFTPRKTRIAIYDGPELRPDQLGLGRGWQNVERTGNDVTGAVLARAREHVETARTTAPRTTAPQTTPPGTTALRTTAPPTWEALRERAIGRLSAGPMSFEEIVAMAADLMPDSTAGEQLAAGERAAVELLRSGAAQLAPLSGR
jgi:hypothetical protein